MQRKTIYFAVGLIVASFLLSSNLSVGSASAASATITTNTNITLNASSVGNGVTIDEESIGITTTCNKGYDLTIATSTSTDLYLNGDSTKTAAFTAVDGTSALDSTNNTNKWGYTTISDATSSTVFSPLSTTASSIRTISQTTDITSETIPIYYGIKTDNTVDPGTYTMGNNGTIVYYLTMNPQCNVVDIAYDGNNADAGTMGAEGTGVIHKGKKDGDTVDLIASNFSRDGYGFAGWSLDKDAGEKLLDNDNTNNPIVYGPQESVTLPEGFADNDTDNDGIVKLYAVWLQSQGNLQGWMGCSDLDTATYDSTTGALDLTKNSVTALTDMRDHDTYAVARLADGKCWMIENLRLEAEDTRTPEKQALAQGYGTSTTYGNFSGLADAESTGFTSTYSANSLYSNDGSNDTINIGTSNYPAYRMPRYNNLNNPADANNRPQNPTSNTFANNNTTVGMYSYGNYYTWHAAIADLAYNGTDNQSTTGTSLCPTGWHLPKGGDKTNESNNEFWSLVVGDINGNTKPANYDSSAQPYYTGTPEGTDASNKLRAYPNNFLYSGFFFTSSASYRGSSGYYWSSTARDTYNSYDLYLSSSYVYPGTNYDNKNFGCSIRCTASEPETYTLSYDANGGTSVPEPQAVTANGSATFTISDVVPTHSRCSFAGWEDANANIVQPGGTYTTNETNTTLRATWTCPYEIAYDINTTDTNAEGTMGNQTKDDSGADLAENAQVTLLASNFSRTGYGFAGWSLDADAATNASAKIYGPQETIAAPSASTYGNNGVVTLYAVWVPSAGSIQDATVVSNVCNGLTIAPTDGTANISSVSALTDQRDNETYAIARLADGNCWMIENLRLEAEDTRTPEKQALAQGYGASATYGNFSGLADAESTGFSGTYSANSLYSNDGSNDTINIGTSNYPAYRMPRYNNLNSPVNANDRPQNPTSNTFTNNNTTVGMYSYGNYYTWHAAIADTTSYSSGDHNTTSICPTGWQLPLGNTSTGDIEQGATDAANKVGGFSYLDRKMGGTGADQSTAAASLRWRTFPNNFLYSGYSYTSSADGRGSYGRYWSSTAYDSSRSYGLYLSSSIVRPGTGGGNKFIGFSLRCTVSAGT